MVKKETTDHVAHLIRNTLQPTLYALRPRDHPRHLRPHDRQTRERLPERLPLVDPLHAALNQQPLCPRTGAAHDPTLVVEVAEHDEDPRAFFAEGVGYGDAHVVEGDESGAGGGGVGGLDGLRGYAVLTFDEDDGEAVVGFAADCEAIQMCSVMQTEMHEIMLLTSPRTCQHESQLAVLWTPKK